METILAKLVAELPATAIIAGFAYLLVQIVRQVLSHYQKMIDESLSRLTESIHKLREKLDLE